MSTVTYRPHSKEKVTHWTKDLIRPPEGEVVWFGIDKNFKAFEVNYTGVPNPILPRLPSWEIK